jgi:hypothetical protein
VGKRTLSVISAAAPRIRGVLDKVRQAMLKTRRLAALRGPEMTARFIARSG